MAIGRAMVVVRGSVIRVLVRDLCRVLTPERQTEGLVDMTTRGDAQNEQQREHDPDPPQERSAGAPRSPIRHHRDARLGAATAICQVRWIAWGFRPWLCRARVLAMKRRGQQRHARAARARAALTCRRLLSMFVLALFVSQSTLAFAAAVASRDSCCDESAPDPGDQDDEDRDCPCPLDCSKGCAGSFMRGVPSTPLSLDLPLLPAIARSSVATSQIPPAATPIEILHVPKR